MRPSGPPCPRRFTSDKYHRKAELGWFEGQRVELIDGEIIQKSPHGSAHAIAIGLAQIVRCDSFGTNYWVRIQLPLTLGARGEPEPDLAVVKGRPRVFRSHPISAILVVEIADTSLQLDLGRKASLCASAGVSDYVVVDLNVHKLHVHGRPVADSPADFGYRYDSVHALDDL